MKRPTPHHEYGAMIREARDRRGLTQVELGDAVGIGQAFIANAESGRKVITKPETVAKLAAALNLDTAQLDRLWALAGRIPPDIGHRLAGDYDAIRTVRAALDRMQL